MPKVTVMVGGSIGCAGSGFGHGKCARCVSATVALVMPAMDDDVARFGHVDGCLAKAAEGQDLGDAEVFDQLAVARQRLDGLAGLQRAGFNAARQDAAR